MTANHAMHAYRKVGVYSGAAYADPHQLIGMLLDGALDRVARAKGAMRLRQTAQKGELIGNAMTIIGGLKGCLDMEQGDALSNNLADLYDYMCRRLLQANVADDAAGLDEVADLLREIKQAWDAIPDAVRSNHTARVQESA